MEMEGTPRISALVCASPQECNISQGSKQLRLVFWCISHSSPSSLPGKARPSEKISKALRRLRGFVACKPPLIFRQPPVSLTADYRNYNFGTHQV